MKSWGVTGTGVAAILDKFRTAEKRFTINGLERIVLLDFIHRLVSQEQKAQFVQY
jgi:hypothetical protein